MSGIELSEGLFGRIAGWDVVKQARISWQADKVLSASWEPPLLRGVVQEGGSSYRAGLSIKDAINVENLCTCRQARQWGTICSHSIAVGLRMVKGPPVVATQSSTASAQSPLAKNLQSPAIDHSIIRSDPGGEFLKLHIIIPPNFLQALVKDKMMVVFEAETSQGKISLGALPKSKSYKITPEDGSLISCLNKITREVPAMLILSRDQLCALLVSLAGHPRVTLGKSEPITVSNGNYQLTITGTLQPTGQIQLTVRRLGSDLTLLAGDKLWVYRDREFWQLKVPASLKSILEKPVLISREDVPRFISQDWPLISRENTVSSNFKLEDFVVVAARPRIVLHLNGGLAQLAATLHCVYGARVLVPGAERETTWIPDPVDPKKYLLRDFSVEQSAVATLTRSGFAGPESDQRFHIQGQDRVLQFFARVYPRLKKEWEVTLEERLARSKEQNIEEIEPSFEVTSSGVEWFDFKVSYQTGSGEKLSASDIQRLLLSGSSHTRLKNGKMAIIDIAAIQAFQEVLVDTQPMQKGDVYHVKASQGAFITTTLAAESSWNIKAPGQWMNQVRSQTGEAVFQCPPIGSLEDVLRPYQKQGVGWLSFLRQNGFAGILADDMGLGKTLQALALLRSARTGKERGTLRPCLVICPTSLVFNWVDEAARFTPELKTLAISGPNRSKKFAEINSADLVITSYSLVRRDIEVYAGLEFDTILLDEAQHIKNRQTQNAAAVKLLRSDHRFVLTGTPIENSVLDLWSIFDFLMPGYLGNAKDFKERYEIPITREKNQDAQSRLSRRLKPFVLRRLKRDVAKDLPEKIEQVSFCELTDEQSKVYQEMLNATRTEVLNAVGKDGVQKSRMLVLSALLRLRQICCDLRLLKLPDLKPDAVSAKLDLFSELLQQAIDGDHRVLVFSQFVSMLHLIREKLTAENIQFCYLDGSTTDRRAEVEKFQSTPAITVFLISLKAGGVGLNLTGADTVIHFDPWWNPAVEDQATDRAHRIGQNRVVTSYKLITRGTVEEKILLLQQKKREIIK
ncbi:MAG: ywqA, partial [Verrucomicrobiales bacterium]|nr:ywqA [Verrucomicrobiales bacterium]